MPSRRLRQQRGGIQPPPQAPAPPLALIQAPLQAPLQAQAQAPAQEPRASSPKQPLLRPPAPLPQTRHRPQPARESPFNFSLVSYTLQDLRYARDVLRELTVSRRYTQARRQLPEAWLKLAFPFTQALDELRAIAGRVLPSATRFRTRPHSSSRSLDKCPLKPLDPTDPEAAIVSLIQGLHLAVSDAPGCDWIEYTRVVLFTLHDMVTNTKARLDCRTWADFLLELITVLLTLHERYRNTYSPYDHAAMEDVQYIILQLVMYSGCTEEKDSLMSLIKKLVPARGSAMSQWVQALRDPAYRTVDRFVAADMLMAPAAYVSLIGALYAAVDAITDMAAVMPAPAVAALSEAKTVAQTNVNIMKTQLEVLVPSVAWSGIHELGAGLPLAAMNSVRYKVFEPLVNQYVSTMRQLYDDAGVKNAMADTVFAALKKHAYDNPVQLLPAYVDRARGALGTLHTEFLKRSCPRPRTPVPVAVPVPAPALPPAAPGL